jgi:hypothetical protein
MSDDLFSSDSESLPELVDMPLTSSSSTSIREAGLCELCFETRHETLLDCPVLASTPPLKNAVITTDNGGFLVGVWYLDDFLAFELIRTFPDRPDRAAEIRRVLDIAIGPVLNEWITFTPERTMEAVTAAEREARRVFTDFIVDFEREPEEQQPQEARGREQDAAAALCELAARTNEEGTATDPSLSRSSHPIAQPIPVYAPPPIFNIHHGGVVTRDAWSSSSASASVTTSNNTSYDEVDPYLPVFHRLETLSAGNWSPAVSEWSVSDWGFLFNPQWVIEEAVSRLLTQSAQSAHSIPPLSTSASSREPGSFPPTPVSLEDPYHPTQPAQYPLFLDTRDTSSAELQETLYYWVYEGGLHQLDHLHFEDDMGAEPAHQALRALHGPLNAFVDYTAMAAQGDQDFQHPSPLPFDFARLPPVSDDAPDELSTSTSLDHSLPTSVERTTLSTIPEVAEGQGDGDVVILVDASQEGIRMDLLHPGPSSNKRKTPADEREPPYQNGRRKKLRKFTGDLLRQTIIEREAYKATGFTDAHVIRMMARVHLASVEAAHRIEDMVWHRYGITAVCPPLSLFFRASDNSTHGGGFQESFPAKLVQHPFLFDVEVAKIQTLWHVLQRHNRTQLAGLLHDLLSIRLRDEYAVSRLLTARFLDDHYPELASNYWELLSEPGDRLRHDTRSDFGESTDDTLPEYSPNDNDGLGADNDSRFCDAGVGQCHVHCNAFIPSGLDVA